MFWVWIVFGMSIVTLVIIAIIERHNASNEQSEIAAIDPSIVKTGTIEKSNFAIGNGNIQISDVEAGRDIVAGDIIHTETHYHCSSSEHLTISKYLHQIPMPPGDFVGRNVELNEILDKVEHEVLLYLGNREISVCMQAC